MPARLVGGLAALLLLAGCDVPPAGTRFDVVFPPQAGDIDIDALPLTFVDQSGLVIAVAVEPPGQFFEGVEPVPGAGDQLLAGFISGACTGSAVAVLRATDDRLTLTVKTSDRFPTLGCVALGIGRVVRISFSRPVDPDELVVDQEH
jgi:hypothetical protein